MKKSAKSVGVNPPQVACWIKQVKIGDEEAARALLDYLYPHLMKIVNSRLTPRMSRDDIVQEILIKVFTKLEQYSGKVPLTHWVSRIAVNVCTTAYHKDKSNRELRMADLSEEAEDVVRELRSMSTDLHPSRSVAANELVEMLLEQLKPIDRMLVDLIYLQGYNHREVFELTGWNINLTKVRIFRARQKLRKALAILIETEPAYEEPALGLPLLPSQPVYAV